MPFTTIALDRLIEPKASKKPIAADKNENNSRQGTRINGTDKSTERKHHWNQISPALYATPEPTPLPDSPSSFAPSPYIVDHKRRGPRLSKAYTEDVIALHKVVADENIIEIVKSFEAEDVESCSVVNDTDINIVRDAMVNGKRENEDVNADVATRQENLESVELDRNSEMDDFFDPQDSMSVRSSIDREYSCGLERSLNLNSSTSEFYDAWEELSSESGSQLSSRDFETELREMRLSLLVEMEKRKQAEEYLNNMRSQWAKIREHLSFVGLNLPQDSTVLQDHSIDNIVDDLTRQVHLIRFVSNSIGRGIAKAELEPEMQAQLESKNFEIARLLDRLRYYEAVNHEMSQRNQETVETMRRVRQRRKKRQRWVWGSIVAAVTVASAAALIWSYGKGSYMTDHPSPQTSEGSSSGSAQ